MVFNGRHLYNRPLPSLRPSVLPSLHRAVCKALKLLWYNSYILIAALPHFGAFSVEISFKYHHHPIQLFALLLVKYIAVSSYLFYLHKQTQSAPLWLFMEFPYWVISGQIILNIFEYITHTHTHTHTHHEYRLGLSGEREREILMDQYQNHLG